MNPTCPGSWPRAPGWRRAVVWADSWNRAPADPLADQARALYRRRALHAQHAAALPKASGSSEVKGSTIAAALRRAAPAAYHMRRRCPPG